MREWDAVVVQFDNPWVGGLFEGSVGSSPADHSKQLDRRQIQRRGVDEKTPCMARERRQSRGDGISNGVWDSQSVFGNECIHPPTNDLPRQLQGEEGITPRCLVHPLQEWLRQPHANR